MDAPDDHWLLVKNLWLPIEKSINNAGAIGDDINEKIESLAGVIKKSVIDDLHYLRMERNALIHKNKPLQDYKLWQEKAAASILHLRPLASETANPSKSSAETFKNIVYFAISFAAWGAGSYFLKEFCELILTKVNQFSFAWWVVGIVWTLCWPGILIVGLVGGAIFYLGKFVLWLLINPAIQ